MSIALRSAAEFVNFDNALPDKRTYIVLGVPRGGTSMTAGLLRISGVNMGDNIDPDNNEDHDFLSHGGDWGRLKDPDSNKELIKEYRGVAANKSRNNKVWGWKDPLCSLYVPKLLNVVHNPYIVFVTRDISACAFRERVEYGTEFAENDSTSRLLLRKMGFANDLYARTISMISDHQLPTLLVSYERSLRYKEDLATSILEFSGCEPGSDDFKDKTEKAIQYISPDRISGNIDSDPTAALAESNKFNAIFDETRTFTDLYGQAAEAVNSSMYEDAIMYSDAINYLSRNGFLSATHLAASTSIVEDADCAACFIKSMAQVNLGKTKDALESLHLFEGKLQILNRQGAKKGLSHSITLSAETLKNKILSSIE